MMEKTEKVNIQDIAAVLFESAAEGLVVTNKRGVIEAVNPRVGEMFGYTEKELIGQKVELLIPEHSRNRHKEHRRDYAGHPVKRSMGIGLELQGRRSNGECFPVEVSLNYFEVDNEQMFMALISDVTERVKADHALKQLNQELEKKVMERTRDMRSSQHLYRLIARNYPNGVINVFDRDLNYVFVEGQELYRLGINSKRLVGTNYLKRLAPEIRGEIKEKLQHVLDGQDTSIQINYRNNAYLLNAVALPGDKGEIDRILVVEQNITKMKKAEQDMLEALQKEKQLSELKSRFVSMASHEFRTPLTTVQSSLSLLKKYIQQENTEAQQEKHFARIRSSIQHLTNILNDFLSIDKLEEGMVQVHLIPCHVPVEMEDLVDEMRQSAKPGQVIEYTHHGGKDVQCDKQVLKNIFNNLLSNAIKYSGEEGIIKVETTVKGESWTIRVTDNGIGIPQEEQKHLFDRFFRARNATNIQGTGLGLSIIGKYVDLLGGHITFESEENRGTSFTVSLPVKPELTAV